MTDTIITPSELLQHLTELTASANPNAGLLLIRLHGLRRMGTIFGPRLAEQILVDLIAKFNNGLRADDQIFRIGRFEFAILLPKLLNRGHAVLAANKLAGILAKPITLRDKERKLGFSIGLTITPEHTREPDKLFRFAELAAITAKLTQAPYYLYMPDQSDQLVTDWDIEGDLDRAIANNEFRLYYQPKFSAKTGQILGAEALMRWLHPTHGLIPPERFISVAERIGIMPKLTWWCLNTALRERLRWGKATKNLSVAVNISALDLTDESFIKSVTSAVGIWNTRPELLTLEITEGSLMQDIAFSSNLLKKIRDHGIHVSIDDFGTGYSSLAYFKQLPADELKIDRSFILNILDDELDQHIVRTIIQMAKRLNLTTVAEGVETAQMKQRLIELGCDIIQGYHIAHPMPHRDFISWLSGLNQ